MTGEWLEKSSDSDNSSIIYVTSTSELPIWRLNVEEYCKLSPHRRGDWNLPTSTTLRRTSVSSQDWKAEEGEIIKGNIANSGAAWTPSR
jgi:hypothetical protein